MNDNALLWKSFLAGIVAVASFSLTAPATKVAIHAFSPLAVTGIRGLLAGLFCIGFLLWKRKPVPSKKVLAELFAVAVFGSAGFSACLALGLQTVPASHAAVFLAMLPLATAIFSQVSMGEQTTPLFWVGAISGAAVSSAFMIHRAHGQIGAGDVFLVLSVLFAAWGYVRVAKVSRQLGGARAMSWVVVLGAPIYTLLLYLGKPDWSVPLSTESVVALIYLGTVSQSLGMFLWCWSLSTGYATLVSQTQMVQPFLSILAAFFFLGEAFNGDLFLVAGLVLACVALSTWAKVHRPAVAIARH